MTGNMDFDDRPNPGSYSALEKARQVSVALSEAARKARFSTRSRKTLVSGGFQARRGAGLMSLFIWATFALIVVIPVVSASIYYGLLASDQYVAEARFTIMGGEVPSPDAIDKMTGIPAIAIIQDTQIVTNYIHSRAALEKLESRIGVRARYSRDDIDFVARFDPSKPIEKFVKYWDGMSSTSIGMPSGIVELKVRAFSASDAVDITRAILKISEDLINELNDRMNGDAVHAAEQELRNASNRLATARSALETARNEESILDATKSGDSLSMLVTQLKAALLQMQQDYETSRRTVSPSAPQMRAFQARIDATQTQIRELESRMTASSQDTASGRTLSQSLTRFSRLELERQIAERLYASAAGALEIARMIAERKMMYLNTFVEPVAPQEARYPKRLLYSAVTLAGSLALWGALVGLVVATRNNMA